MEQLLQMKKSDERGANGESQEELTSREKFAHTLLRSRIRRTRFKNASVTLCPSLADVSTKRHPSSSPMKRPSTATFQSRRNESSRADDVRNVTPRPLVGQTVDVPFLLTWRSSSRSHLFPTRTMGTDSVSLTRKIC